MMVIEEYFWQKVQLKKKNPKQPNYTYNRATRHGQLNDNNGIVWRVCAITENGINQVCYALNISRNLSSYCENPKGSQRVDNEDYSNEKDRGLLHERYSQMLMCASSYCIVFVQSKKRTNPRYSTGIYKNHNIIFLPRTVRMVPAVYEKYYVILSIPVEPNSSYHKSIKYI